MIASVNEPKTRIQKKNQAAILDAALEVFSVHGFRGSTVDQIASAAGLSKPNLLYYFPSKEAMHNAVLGQLLETWLDPLEKLNPDGNPIDEILKYVMTKLADSWDFPRESRLFATEIIQGAPRIGDVLKTDLRTLVDAKTKVIQRWIDKGKLAPVDTYHLIFSIWSLTQHYADFDVQVQAVLGRPSEFEEAEAFLENLYRRMLTP